VGKLIDRFRYNSPQAGMPNTNASLRHSDTAVYFSVRVCPSKRRRLDHISSTIHSTAIEVVIGRFCASSGSGSPSQSMIASLEEMRRGKDATKKQVIEHMRV